MSANPHKLAAYLRRQATRLDQEKDGLLRIRRRLVKKGMATDANKVAERAISIYTIVKALRRQADQIDPKVK